MPTASITWSAANPVSIDWGDGSAAGSGSATGTATHTYADPGAHTITITDTVAGGTASQTVTCPVPPCALTVTNTPNAASATATVTTGLTSGYTIDWGDGSSVDGVLLNAPVSHTYGLSGSYAVSAHGTTFSGSACAGAVTVTVPTFTLAATTPVAGAAPLAVTVRIAPAGAAVLAGVPFEIDWGDGTAVTALTYGPGADTAVHTFTVAGSFTPRACRMDTAECSPLSGPVVVS